MAKGPRRQLGGIRIFYSLSILWEYDLSSIGVKWFLLKSDFRFSKILSPGEPLQSRWSLAAPEDFEDTLWFSLETLCLLLLQFPSTEISLWINTYTGRAYFYFQSILLLQDTPRIFCAYCLAVFATWIPLRIISRTSEYPLIPSCSGVSQNSSKCHSIFWNPQ